MLSDNLTGCTGSLLLLGGYGVLQKGIESFTEFWFVFMLDSKRMFVKCLEEIKKGKSLNNRNFIIPFLQLYL